jgi:hypothetical protein
MKAMLILVANSAPAHRGPVLGGTRERLGDFCRERTQDWFVA